MINADKFEGQAAIPKIKQAPTPEINLENIFQQFLAG